MEKDDNILKRSLISALIFILFVVIVFYFIFRKNDIRVIFHILKNTKKLYLLVAIFCMACFSICEAINLKRTLKLCGTKVSFLQSYKYALGGFFVSSITPSSSGGDPMQLYLMTKDKVPISHSAIALLTKLLTFQFVVIIVSLFSFIFRYNLFSNMGYVKYLIFLGMFLNFLVFLLYLLIIFYKSVIEFLVEIFSKLLKKFHYKKIDLLKEKINSHILEYERAAKVLKKNPKTFFLNILTTLIEMLLYYSISYFVYLSFGFDNENISTFIAIQSVLFISVSFLPFPGAVGASEATFMQLYKNIYGNKILGSAMVITRFINFYLFVLYSGIVILSYILEKNLKNSS